MIPLGWPECGCPCRQGLDRGPGRLPEGLTREAEQRLKEGGHSAANRFPIALVIALS
jgi:hypothetical protein